MAGQANSLISHGSLVGTIKTSNAVTNSLVGRLNVDNTITGRMDTSSLTGALDTDNAITSQSGSISTDDQMVGVLNANNTIAGGVGTAYNPAYALVDEAAAQIVLYINNTDYKFYAELKDKNGSHIANSNIIDLPLESMVVNGSYDSTNKEIVLTLNNGNTLRFSVADLVSGLVSTTDLSTVLLNYVEFTDYANGTNAGVIKTSSSYATETSDGVLRAQNKTYAQYESLSNNAFIGKGTLDNAITGKELTNKTYVDNADKVFEDDLFNNGYVINEGTDISLDTKLGKPEIELKGNTIQNEVPTPEIPQLINVVSGRQEVDIVGKNFLVPFNASNVGVDVSTENYTITINGTSTGSSNFVWSSNFYLKAGTYRVNTKYVSGTIDNNVQLIFRKYNSNANLLGLTFGSSNYQNNKNETFVLDEDTYVRYTAYVGGSGRIYDNFKFNIQLTQSASADYNFELYKGQSYEINLGKNLFNFTTYTTDAGGLNSTISGTNWVCSGTATSTSKYITDYIANTYQAGTYTFSITETLPKNLILRFFDANNTTLSSNIITASNKSITFTLTGNEKKYRLIFNPTTNEEYDINVNLQLEKGNQVTSYSPYKTPIELCKISDYKDRIYKENGTWYIEKQIGKIVLDGSENWTNGGLITNVRRYSTPLSDVKLNDNSNKYCNYFKYVVDWNLDEEHFYISDSSGNLLLFSTYTDMTQFKTWLNAHNTIVYYILATPTTTEIIDSELISQLESIELLEGLNNVLMSSSGDLPGIIKIKAFSNTTAGSITRLEKIVEFLGDSIGDIGTLLDEIQGEVI